MAVFFHSTSAAMSVTPTKRPKNQASADPKYALRANGSRIYQKLDYNWASCHSCKLIGCPTAIEFKNIAHIRFGIAFTWYQT
jgi:hypothetical protein